MKKQVNKPNILVRIFRFFFPSNFMEELNKGIGVGAQRGQKMRDKYDKKKGKK